MELKRTKVVMLPTNKGINLPVLQYFSDGTKHLDFYNTEVVRERPKQGFTEYQAGCIVPQHLYIISDHEIKEGDWYIYANEVFKSTGNSLLSSSQCKKIIATTDKSLRIQNIMMSMSSLYLPQPSQAFIKKYCKSGGIDEVLVEYECLQSAGMKIVDFSKTPPIDIIDYPCECIEWKLKVDSHNTITIHPIKNTLTLEEFYEFKTLADRLLGINVAIHPNDYDKAYKEYHQWAKDNL
jgi:hypothetical protein